MNAPVHLLAASELAWLHGYPSTMITVCGEELTAGEQAAAADPWYCVDCVVEAARWNGQSAAEAT